jgi:hypothetical protein
MLMHSRNSRHCNIPANFVRSCIRLEDGHLRIAFGPPQVESQRGARASKKGRWPGPADSSKTGKHPSSLATPCRVVLPGIQQGRCGSNGKGGSDGSTEAVHSQAPALSPGRVYLFLHRGATVGGSSACASMARQTSRRFSHGGVLWGILFDIVVIV